MSHFTRYVIKIYLKYLIIVQVLITVVTMFSSALSHLQGSKEFGITLPQLVKLELITMPMGINSALPITIVVSAIVTVILLMRSNELLAYISIGGRIMRFITPFIILSFIVAGCMFVFDAYFYPTVREAQQRYRTEVIQKRKYNEKSSLVDIWTFTENQSILHLAFMDAINASISNYTEYKLDENFQISEVVTSPYVQYIEADGSWIFYDRRTAKVNTVPPEIIYEQNVSTKDAILDDMISITSGSRHISLKEISQLIKVMSNRGLSTTKYDMLLYGKYANALSVIVLSLLIVPIGINFSRRYSLVKNATLAFSFGIAYWVFSSTLFSLGNNGIIPPIPANFLPHILFLAIGGFILYRREQAR